MSDDPKKRERDLRQTRERLAELGCDPVGDDPVAFVERGGLQALEKAAAKAAIRALRAAALPLILDMLARLDGRKLSAKDRDVLRRKLGWDRKRLMNTLGLRRPTIDDVREQTRDRVRRFRERQRGDTGPRPAD